MRKKRKLQTPRPAVPSGPIRVTYCSTYLDYIGYKLDREAKGEPVEGYLDYLDRVALERRARERLTTEEMLRRINNSQRET